jgi:hypothetical protein
MAVLRLHRERQYSRVRRGSISSFASRGMGQESRYMASRRNCVALEVPQQVAKNA